MNKALLSCLVASCLVALTSCNNQANSKAQSNEQHSHSHDGHDHAHHDHASHSGHEHHDHAPKDTPTKTQQANAQNTSATAEPEPSNVIPNFTFYKVKSGISFNNQDITKGKKTVFILFDPSCHHCRDEAGALGKNYDKIKDINIYFVSMNDPALMSTFLETFAPGLVNKPNVQVLYDRNQEFIQKFHVPKQFPANYVYSKDGQLETHWAGGKNPQDIIAAYIK